MNIFKRYEVKYLLSYEQRQMIETALKEYMVPDEYGESTICNLYYDTPDYRLIRRSIEKPLYKEKLRMRSYGRATEDKIIFLELKKKYKGVVYKRRISLDYEQAREYIDEGGPLPDNTQIAREINYFCDFYKNLSPTVYLCYDRTAYFSSTDRDLRITFDRNIRWRQDDLDLSIKPYGEQLLEDGQSLMEIKAAGAMPLWLVDLLSKGEIRKRSFSKYGTAYETVLKNELKERRGVCCV